MHWLQLIIDTSSDQAPGLSDALNTIGALSVALKDRDLNCVNEVPIYEPGPDGSDLWPQTRVIALFQSDTNMDNVLQQLEKILKLSSLPLYKIEKLDNQDWERVWMDSFQAMRFGKRLWICPSEHEPPDPDAINILLDPGLAFGTGTHPTTALCLEWLDQHDLNGLDVVDYGCGSGVLAIAATMLGAKHAWGIDIDEQALYATKENALKNNMQNKISTYLPKDLTIQVVDVLLANILANPLQELACEFSKRVCSNGQLLLSGILKEQGDAVSKAYLPWFDIKSIQEKENWVCIYALRRSD